MRFYNKEIPNVDEIVMCHVEKIQEYCIYVKLLEYDNIEGMVQLADASTRRKRKSVCLLKVNKKYPLLVIRVDEKNKYIDLSNKFLSEEDKDDGMKRYNKYSFVIKMLKTFLSKKQSGEYDNNLLLEYAKKTIWKIESRKCYNYLIDNYINHLNFDDFDINQEDKDILKGVLENSLGDILFKSQLNFMARNTDFEGILNIQEAFEVIKDKFNLVTMLDVAPNYYISVESDSESSNLELLGKLEPVLKKKLLGNECLYKKLDIVTTNNLD